MKQVSSKWESRGKTTKGKGKAMYCGLRNKNKTEKSSTSSISTISISFRNLSRNFEDCKTTIANK